MLRQTKGIGKERLCNRQRRKKFRDSAISSEDLDDAIANRIELAFKEHQSTLNSVVNSAVRDAMDSVLIPALCELREDIQATNKSVKGIVHFEIKIWYLSAYPKGIQDVGVFFSSVDPILMFLGQTVLVCQSYNGRYRSLSL